MIKSTKLFTSPHKSSILCSYLLLKWNPDSERAFWASLRSILRIHSFSMSTTGIETQFLCWFCNQYDRGSIIDEEGATQTTHRTLHASAIICVPFSSLEVPCPIYQVKAHVCSWKINPSLVVRKNKSINIEDEPRSCVDTCRNTRLLMFTSKLSWESNSWRKIKITMY